VANRRRHHYLPRFYLERFVDTLADPPTLWIYDKVDGAIRSSAPRSAGVEKDYYAFRTADGSRDSDSFEDALSKADDEAAPVLGKLIETGELTDVERQHFARFLALTMSRGPVYRRNFERLTAALVKRLTQRRAKAGGFDDVLSRSPESEAAETVKRLLAAGEFDVDVIPQISLPIIGKAIERFVPIIERMSWMLIRGHGRTRFVASDNPFTYVDPTHDPRSPYGVGLLTPGVQVTMPLSPDVALVAGWDGEHERGLGTLPGEEAWIADVNRRTIAGAAPVCLGIGALGGPAEAGSRAPR
jgi:hypothetical protein